MRVVDAKDNEIQVGDSWIAWNKILFWVTDLENTVSACGRLRINASLSTEKTEKRHGRETFHIESTRSKSVSRMVP